MHGIRYFSFSIQLKKVYKLITTNLTVHKNYSKNRFTLFFLNYTFKPTYFHNEILKCKYKKIM